MDASAQGMDDLAEDLEKISTAAKKWLAYVNTDLDSAEIEDRKVPVPTGMSQGATQSSEQTSKVSKSTTKAGNLLVVDDNEGNRDLLSRSLERQGYSVETAADGEQALDMVKSADFDLVLLDVLMPGMDGLQVLERLKADEASQDIPIVVLSSLEDSEGVERSMELGTVDYIP